MVNVQVVLVKFWGEKRKKHKSSWCQSTSVCSLFPIESLEMGDPGITLRRSSACFIT